MAYDRSTFDSSLAAALGDDPALLTELHQAFHEAAGRQIDLMRRARCDANWEYAAAKLKSVAGSFGVLAIVDLADEALEGAPGDPVILRKLREAFATE